MKSAMKATMKSTFQKWLFFVIVTTFVMAFGLSYFRETIQSQRNALMLIRLKIEDAKKQIDENHQNLEVALQTVKQSALVKAKTLRRIIQLDPQILDNPEQLEKVRQDLNADEIHVSDETGRLIQSLPPDERYINYEMGSQEQSAVFMPALTDPNFELIQGPLLNGAAGRLLLYAGVARQDKPGIIQVGYYPQRFVEAKELFSIENLAYGFRIGKNGKILICEDICDENGVPVDQNILSINESQWMNKTVSAYGVDYRKMLEPKGSFFANINGIKKQCVYERIYYQKNVGECTEDEYQVLTILGSLPENEMYLNRDRSLFELFFSHVLLYVMVFVLISFLVQKTIVEKIYHVNQSLQKITEGDLGVQVTVRTNKEFMLLSDGINQTVDALKAAIIEAATRIDNELEFAKAIQYSALPCLEPFTHRKEIDLFATIQTAKQVGGDFYDFFFLDDDHLVIEIADVSGKGIPAALFMMTSKTMIKNVAMMVQQPSEIYSQANTNLAENNQASMFVTAFLGVLELSTGKFQCVSAGHNPPLLRRNGELFEYQKIDGGIILGAMAGIEYTQSELLLHPGDMFYLYTDGVSEALNEEGEYFGEERLREILNSEATRSMASQELLEYYAVELKKYTKNAEQSDDITMVAFKYNGNVQDGSNELDEAKGGGACGK